MPSLEITFQCINAIGSLATFGAFIFLFLKDNNKQNQIDKLASIAIILKTQNKSMIANNSLLSQQVDVLRSLSFTGDSGSSINALVRIEEKKMKLAAKPEFSILSSSSSPDGSFKFHICNVGSDAIITNFNLMCGDVYLNQYSVPFKLKKDSDIVIGGKSNGTKNISQTEYEIEIMYNDKLNTIYSTQIIGKGAHVRIEEAIELETQSCPI